MGSIDFIHEETPKELLEAHSHLWNHTFSFINSLSLRCAVELGIPDAIHKHGRAIALSELSSALSIPPSRTPCLRRLLRLLVHSKFFSKENSGGDEGEELYSLTPASEILVKERRTSLLPFTVLFLDRIFLEPWHFLGSWLTSEEPPTAFEMAHGMPIWEATNQVPEFNGMMNVGMSSDASFTAQLIVRDCGPEVFQGLRSLVDVGGGTGALAMAIADAFPVVKCAVLELPQVVAGQKDCAGVQFIRGDMFEHVPPADATLLKWVLHDWNDEECVQILKRCKEAILASKAARGKVIIIEMVVDISNANHDDARTQLLFDVHMMVHTTGKQRSEVEWRKIFADAGFRGYKVLHVLGLRSLIEVYP